MDTDRYKQHLTKAGIEYVQMIRGHAACINHYVAESMRRWPELLEGDLRAYLLTLMTWCSAEGHEWDSRHPTAQEDVDDLSVAGTAKYLAL